MTSNTIRVVPCTRRDGFDVMSIALELNVARGQ
ncbi:hypothetical protein FEP95_03390 [Burkholderia multivorans]|nr:hypothetical protein NP80_2204 [Burkholderia multivorans ATCC BAA-247]MDR8749146.1 hypothetical protein [Burkholderia multivorans]MDR8808318.1 hypothetical protein [Burkholderia multivorans]SAK15383.1 hypothetical protein UA21_01146 [Burkholderia multivorans]SAK15414.1 hypothetical protein UA19_01143 [Burkholderia multivorans]